MDSVAALELSLKKLEKGSLVPAEPTLRQVHPESCSLVPWLHPSFGAQNQ